MPLASPCRIPLSHRVVALRRRHVDMPYAVSVRRIHLRSIPADDSIYINTTLQPSPRNLLNRLWSPGLKIIIPSLLPRVYTKSRYRTHRILPEADRRSMRAREIYIVRLFQRQRLHDGYSGEGYMKPNSDVGTSPHKIMAEKARLMRLQTRRRKCRCSVRE